MVSGFLKDKYFPICVRFLREVLKTIDDSGVYSKICSLSEESKLFLKQFLKEKDVKTLDSSYFEDLYWYITNPEINLSSDVPWIIYDYFDIIKEFLENYATERKFEELMRT